MRNHTRRQRTVQPHSRDRLRHKRAVVVIGVSGGKSNRCLERAIEYPRFQRHGGIVLSDVDVSQHVVHARAQSLQSPVRGAIRHITCREPCVTLLSSHLDVAALLDRRQIDRRRLAPRRPQPTAAIHHVRRPHLPSNRTVAVTGQPDLNIDGLRADDHRTGPHHVNDLIKVATAGQCARGTRHLKARRAREHGGAADDVVGQKRFSAVKPRGELRPPKVRDVAIDQRMQPSGRREDAGPLDGSLDPVPALEEGIAGQADALRSRTLPREVPVDHHPLHPAPSHLAPLAFGDPRVQHRLRVLIGGQEPKRIAVAAHFPLTELGAVTCAGQPRLKALAQFSRGPRRQGQSHTQRLAAHLQGVRDVTQRSDGVALVSQPLDQAFDNRAQTLRIAS